MLISLHIYCPLTHGICKGIFHGEKLRRSINKWVSICDSQTDSGAAAHFGMSWLSILRPKGVCNVPEVDSNRVSLEGFTGCQTCDVMRSRVNRLPTVTHRGAPVWEHNLKLCDNALLSPGCCQAGWPRVSAFMRQVSWAWVLIFFGFLNKTPAVSCIMYLFLFVVYTSAGLQIKAHDQIWYRLEWQK